MTGAREPAGVSWSPLASEVTLRKALRRIGIGLLAVAVAVIGLPAPAYASDQNLLVQRYSGKCMDVRGDSDSVGAYVQQYDCNHTRAQEWTIALVPGSSNLYTFTAGDGLCLEDRSSFMFNGAPVDQAQCNPYAPQMQWKFLHVFQTWNLIQNVQNGRCLDTEFSVDDWKILLLKDCGTPTDGGGGWYNQQWEVVGVIDIR